MFPSPSSLRRRAGNRQLGYRLGQGEKLEDILSSSTEVAEGYATALSLVLAHIDVRPAHVVEESRQGCVVRVLGSMRARVSGRVGGVGMWVLVLCVSVCLCILCVCAAWREGEPCRRKRA